MSAVSAPVSRQPPKPEAMGCGTRLAIGFGVLVGCYLILWVVGCLLILPVEVAAEPHIQELIQSYGLDALKGVKAKAADDSRFRSEFVAVRVELTEAQRAALIASLDARTHGGFSQSSDPFVPMLKLHGYLGWWPEMGSMRVMECSLAPIGWEVRFLRVYVPNDSTSALFELSPLKFHKAYAPKSDQ